MTPLMLTYPLQANIENGWMFDAFTKIRLQALGSANAFSTMAMAVACVIVVFLMIKTANDLMSDEQSSGFGGVSLWQLLRPILILVCIQNFGMVIGPIDSVADKLSNDITQSITSHDIDAYRAEMKSNEEQMQMIVSRAWGVIDSSKYPINGDEAINYSDLKPADRKMLEDAIVAQAMTSNGGNKTIARGKIRREIKRMGGFTVDSNGRLTMGGDEKLEANAWDAFMTKVTSIGMDDIVMAAFKYAFPIMICSGELLLCVLAMLGPWILVFSLLPWSKTGFIDFVMKYFQISFWKPCGAVIYWATTNALAALPSRQDDILQRITGHVGKDAFNRGQSSFMMVVLGIAGIMMLMKVPSIAATIVPAGGAPVGDAAGGGFAMAAGMARGIGNAPSNTVKGAQTIADIKHGVQGRKQGTANAANIASMSGTLSGMSNTLSGMANPPKK